MHEKDLNFAYLVGAFSIGMLVLIIQAGIPLLVNQTYYAQEPQEVPTSTPKLTFVATHVSTPNPVKGVYISASVAGIPSLRKSIVEMIRDTELNTVVIDVKDDTGRVSFPIEDAEFKSYDSGDNHIQDLREFIENLHKRNIYVIGRIVGFQDPYSVNSRPETAIKKVSDGKIWRDTKGSPWVDPGNELYTRYLATLAQESYALGFDEIQFDGLEYPSTGNIYDAYYPSDEGLSKREVIKKVYAYISTNVRQLGIPTSVSISARSVVDYDDGRVGQFFEDTFKYFNFVSPTLFSAEYPAEFRLEGVRDKQSNELVEESLILAQNRLKIFQDTIASTTISIRPWLQNNEYPRIESPEVVRKQIDAVYTSDVRSWLMFDAASTYTASVFKSAP